MDLDREKAINLLKEYNKEDFHILHGITVGKVMEYIAKENGENVEYWGIVGLLHDVDFEMYPEEHCKKAIEILGGNEYDKNFINSIISHGYGICSEIEPSKYMEKILYSVDELTGLIGAASLMRPSKSYQDMNLKSVKKKFKDKGFAAGCSRDIIKNGADMLDIELDKLLNMTLEALKNKEEEINTEYGKTVNN